MDTQISVRIINVDYCMCAPIPVFDPTYSEFRAAPVNLVPIIRIFGSKSTGEKICLHVHGVFPYFYIPYDGIEEPNSLMYRIASTIDKALNVSFNQSSSTVQHVYKVCLVSGIPMYGYHSKKHQFFKIYLYNPLLINKVSSFMFNETTLGKMYQPHETHLNFTLQFMIDYNLHGMNNINLSEVTFRGQPSTVGNFMMLEFRFKGNRTTQCTTSCELEADAHSRHILNREEVCAGQVTANPGIAALWADERQRRRDHGGQSQLGAFLEISRSVPPTASHNAHKIALLERLHVWVTGVDKEEIGGNDSVYPAETPDGANIQHSSMVDSDLASGTDISSLDGSSLNDTLQMSQYDVTMDGDALEMLEILKQLERSVEESKEDDCILSQVMKEIEDEEDEKEVDMTLPLESIITPKNSPKQDVSCDDIENEDLDTTLIPQLDGQCLDSDEETLSSVSLAVPKHGLETVEQKIKREQFSKNKFIPKAFYIKLIDLRCANKSMPLLDDICAFNDPKDKRVGKLSSVEKGFCNPNLDTHWQKEIPKLMSTNGLHKDIDEKKSDNLRKKNNLKRNLRSVGNILKRSKGKPVKEVWKPVKLFLTPAEEEVRVFEMRLKRMNRSDHVSMLMKKIHRKDRDMILLLSRDCQPVFNVMPSTKYQHSTEERVSKVNAIHYAAARIANYIEPTLHLTIEYPTKQLFHYSYQGGRYFPVVQNIDDVDNTKLMSHPKDNQNPTNIENNQTLFPQNIIDFKRNRNQALEEPLDYNLVDKMRKKSKRVSKINAIQYAAQKVANYIEPTLHLTIEYPTKQLFHYSYQGGRYFPVVQNIDDANKTKLMLHTENNQNPTDIENNQILFLQNIIDFKRNRNQALEESLSYNLVRKMRKTSKLECETDYLENNNLENSKSLSVLEKNKFQEQEEILRDQPNSDFQMAATEVKRGVKRKKESVNRTKNSPIEKKKYLDSEERVRNNLTSGFKSKSSAISDIHSRSVKRKRKSVGRMTNIPTISEMNETIINNDLVNSQLSKRKKCKKPQESMDCRSMGKINDGGNFVCQVASIENNSSNCFSDIDRKEIKQVGSCDTRMAYRASNCPKRKIYTFGEIPSQRLKLTGNTENNLKESQANSKSCAKQRKGYRRMTYKVDTQVSENSNKKTRRRQYLSLDGIIDSSDDENCDKQIKPKRSFVETKSYDNSKYSALPISISQTFKSGIAAEYNLPKLEDAKRKLNFHYSSNNCVNSTVIEDRLDCIYSPVRTKTIKLIDVEPTVTKIEDEKGKSPITPKYSSQSQENNFGASNPSVKNGESLLAQDQNSDFSSDGEISSASCDDEALNTSFFSKLKSEDSGNKKECKELEEIIEPHVSAAARYDMEFNYKAKEGCSTVFTPPISQKSTQSSDDSKITMLTPYQAPNSDENSSELFSSGDTEKFLIYEPLKKAPSRKEVLDSLDFLNIPHIRFEEPYYSNWEDVTGSIEVGYNVLMIKSKSTINLPEFESQTDALNAFRRHRLEDQLQKKANMNKILLSYCKPGDVIITPVQKPPTFKMVVDWMKQRNEEKRTPVKAKPEKIKLHVPSSPGGGENPELDLSLTLTPCSSPMTTQSSPNQSREGSTSPTFTNVCKRRKTEIREKLLGKSLSSQNSQLGRSCEITGLTASASLDFDKSVENLKGARAVLEHQNLTLLVMELHVKTRGELRPDPAFDPIDAIFYSILNDVPENSGKVAKCRGAIVVNALPACSSDNQYPILNGIGIDCDITYVSSEQELLEELLKFVEKCDPDIVAGYEIQMLSWGYLIDRGNTLGMNLKSELGRSKSGSLIRKDDESSKDLRLVGRIVLDVWRIMRHEIAIQSYTFESIVYHILQKRVPYYSFKDLTFWWSHRSNLYRHRTASYYLYRVVTILDLFDKLDLIGRTSELARGSQFRVESMMLRLAKPLNFIPVSPSVQQRAHMQAPEYIPLILEPESKILYPSIIIAYNYCFTTCLGRVKSLGRNTPFKFGATQLKVSRARLDKLLKKDLLNFSPCGVAFVNKEVRDGIMPRMLREILDTRLMVKNSMKENKEDSVLQKVLHNRQLGLKLIANVTYGYTAANFSGRMPAVEVEWGAKVVYGDTDSLFVCVPGRSKERAFEVGALIAEAVTNANPDPVKLKLEKVYQPCILQTKKRYTGYMYETPDQKEPVFEAKGIETVRRDGCPAVRKMLEKCLRILFDTKDVSLVKKYTMRQFSKILAGRVSIQDLTFAKEYRGKNGYAQRACVPALELARKGFTIDRRSEPRSGERVPYVVINGPPGLPIIKLVRSPRDLLNDPSLRLNAQYYITKVIIPPLNRCLQLIGVDVPQHTKKTDTVFAKFSKKSTISQYFSTSNCVACGEQTKVGICDKCTSKPQRTVVSLMEKMRNWEQCYHNVVCLNEHYT
nr:unnamed protein product [Callosobruchus analis]